MVAYVHAGACDDGSNFDTLGANSPLRKTHLPEVGCEICFGIACDSSNAGIDLGTFCTCKLAELSGKSSVQAL